MKTPNAQTAAGDGWQQDPGLAKLIAERFTPAGMFPSSPATALSFVPRSPASMGIPETGAISQGLTEMVNPFGDGRSYRQQEGVTFVETVPAAMRIMAPNPTKNAAAQERTPGYGDPRNPVNDPAILAQSAALAKPTALGQRTKQSLPLGTSFSFSDRGSRLIQRPPAA